MSDEQDAQPDTSAGNQGDRRPVIQVLLVPRGEARTLVDGLPCAVLIAAIEAYVSTDKYQYQVQEAMNVMAPAVAPAPAFVPTVGESPPHANRRAWVSRFGGHLMIMQKDDTPELAPEEVQTMLDFLCDIRAAHPDWSLARVASLLNEVGDMMRPEPPMTLAQFQEGCSQTAVYPGAGNCLLYPLLGLIDETGEVLQVVRKSTWANADVTSPALHLPVLGAAVQLGEIAGILKKAYRNADGLLLTAQLNVISVAIAQLRMQLDNLARGIEVWDETANRVNLPPLVLTPPERAKFAVEIGDVGWYWIGILTEVRLHAEIVAYELLRKLRHRAAAGTLRSTGDDETTRLPGLA
jgi:hypothetical protein